VPFFLGLAILFTWPLAAHIASRIPGGGEGRDALNGLYVLTWGIHALANQPSRFFQSNVFYPHADPLAFNDHLFGLAVPMAPLQWTLANPVVTFNVAVLLSFVVAGLGAYLLARQITGSVRAGLLAGLIYGYSGFRFEHIGQLNVLALHGLPWIFLIGHLYVETHRRRLIYLATFFTMAQAVSSLFSIYALLLAGSLAFATALYRQSRRHSVLFWRDRIHFLVAIAVMLMALYPFLKPYLNHAVEEWASLQPAAAAVQPGASGPPGLLAALFLDPIGGRRAALRGATAIALIAFVVFSLLNREHRDEHRSIFYAGLAVVAVTLTLAFRLPGAALISLSAAILAAMAYQRLEQAAAFLPRGPLLVSVLLLVSALGIYPQPVRLFEPVGRNGPPPVYPWLDSLDSGDAIAELPVPPDGSPGTAGEALRQYYSVFHWHPVVDGVAAWVPAYTRTIRSRLRSFPDDAAMAQIHALRVDHVIVHLAEYPAEARGSLLAQLAVRRELTLEKVFGEDRVYRVE
jgi:hypothetical protein